jgi:hypothetical protein
MLPAKECLPAGTEVLRRFIAPEKLDRGSEPARRYSG